MQRATQPTCADCGSTDLSFDAYAEWNPATQNYELRNVFDEAYCNGDKCHGECQIKWIPYDGPILRRL